MDSRRGLRGAQSERAAINGSQFLFQSGKGIAVTESGGSLERRGSAGWVLYALPVGQQMLIQGQGIAR